MPTNFFYNNYKQSGEQSLLEDLIIESIRMYGIDAYYLPRNITSTDEVFREQEIAKFDSNFGIEMYIKNVYGFKGDNKFLSKFDLEIRDEITFTIAQRVFRQTITPRNGDLIRPREGDLIWFPLNRKVFQIKYVDHEPIFYQLGTLQVWDVTCELFEYTNEEFSCGIQEIDDRYNVLSTKMIDYALLSTDGEMLVDTDGNVLVLSNYNVDSIDNNDQSDVFDNIKDDIIDFSEDNPFSENKFI